MDNNIYNYETVYSNDVFNRAQWKFCPISCEEEISKDIHMGKENKVNYILNQLLGWNKKEIYNFKNTSKRDPICYMFEKIKSCQLDSCKILCSNPDEHFEQKICYPIYKIYQFLKMIDDTAAKHLLNVENRNIILKNIYNENKLLQLQSRDDEESYSLFSLSESIVENQIYKSKFILVVDFLNFEKFFHDDLLLYNKRLNNLMENINQAFMCMLTPSFKVNDKERWLDFILNQINDCDMVVVVFSPEMTMKLHNMLPPGSFNEQVIHPAVNKNEPLESLWRHIITCHKSIAGVIFDDQLTKTVTSFMPVLFRFPTNIKLFLEYLMDKMHNN